VKKLLGVISVLIVLVTVLAGCETLPASSVETKTVAATNSPVLAGKLQINITDAPSRPEIEQVWLTVAGVKIHVAGSDINTTPTTTSTTITSTTQTPIESNDGWISLALVGLARFDLLELQGGLQAKLAVADLDSGKYTQIRMDVTKVEIKLKSETALVEAKLPSNTLKFVHPFEIIGGQVTEITFDFDALQSIKETGNGKFMCQPVIKLTTTKEPKTNGNFEITTIGLPNGGVGTAFEIVTFTAAGGATPYTWSVSAGAIPTGLSFVNGILSGTPTEAKDFTFTVKVEDSTPVGKKSATKEFTVNIAAPGTLQITTTKPPDGTEGTVYTAGTVLKAIGGSGNKTWALASGNIPDGLSLIAATGAITGTPTAKGSFNFTIKVTDSALQIPNSDTQTYTIRINKAP
jgi:hypothetical protein